MKNLNNNNEYDLIIIGAGPVGLFGAFYACLNNLKVLILEIDKIHGGTPLKMYPDKPIYDFPSILEINGKQLVDNLYKQLKTKENWNIKYEQNIKEIIKLDENRFNVITDEKINYYSKNIIISIGYGSFKFKTFSDHIIKINNKDVIHHYVDDLKKYKNKNLIICGGGNSALEYCHLLCPIANKIYLIHHSNKLKAFEELTNNVLNNKEIEKFLNYEIIEINEQHLLIKNNEQETIKEINYDYILAFYGTELIHSNIYENNIWNKKRKIEVNKYFESILISGLYACGTCNDANYNNLLINGMSQITIAIDHIKGDKKSH